MLGKRVIFKERKQKRQRKRRLQRTESIVFNYTDQSEKSEGYIPWLHDQENY